MLCKNRVSPKIRPCNNAPLRGAGAGEFSKESGVGRAWGCILEGVASGEFSKEVALVLAG